jgi:hypothetical protein
MAKRKRSVALFEVIQKDKQFGPRGGVLPTPAWWFKNREQVTGNREQDKTAVTPAPLVPPPVARAGSHEGGRSLSEAVMSRSVFAPQITRTSAAIIAGAIIMVAGLGAGWIHYTHRNTQSPEAILQGPAHPAVMDLVGQKILAPAAPAAASSSAVQAASVQTPLRQINLSYVRIRLYDTQKGAEQGRDLLLSHDIPCTVEHGIPGVAPSLYAVVGLTPFADSSTPDYTAYVQKIKTLFGATKSLKLIKWEPPPQEAAERVDSRE